MTISGLKNRNALKENPFLGTDYEDLWENNPYAGLYYEPTFWDKIGLSNKSKDANAEYDRLYAEYIAGLYDQQRQDEYNSPASEAQRMREAGLNPDLQGLSGASNTDEMNSPNAGPNPALNGQSPIHNILTTITSVLGFATSTMQQIQAIKGMSFDNVSKSLGNFQEFTRLAEPHIVNEYAKMFSAGDKYSGDWISTQDVSANSLGLNRRQTKRYKEAFTALLSSSRFTSAEKAYQNLNANDLAMRHYVGKMTELAYLAQKNKYKGDISKAIYDTNYFDNLDGKTAATAQNRENNNKGWLDKWRNEYYETLYNDFKRGSTLAGLVLIGSSIPAAGLSSVGNIAGSIMKLFK